MDAGQRLHRIAPSFWLPPQIAELAANPEKKIQFVGEGEDNDAAMEAAIKEIEAEDTRLREQIAALQAANTTLKEEVASLKGQMYVHYPGSELNYVKGAGGEISMSVEKLRTNEGGIFEYPIHPSHQNLLQTLREREPYFQGAITVRFPIKWSRANKNNNNPEGTYTFSMEKRKPSGGKEVLFSATIGQLGGAPYWGEYILLAKATINPEDELFLCVHQSVSWAAGGPEENPKVLVSEIHS